MVVARATSSPPPTPRRIACRGEDVRARVAISTHGWAAGRPATEVISPMSAAPRKQPTYVVESRVSARVSEQDLLARLVAPTHARSPMNADDPVMATSAYAIGNPKIPMRSLPAPACRAPPKPTQTPPAMDCLSTWPELASVQRSPMSSSSRNAFAASRSRAGVGRAGYA